MIDEGWEHVFTSQCAQCIFDCVPYLMKQSSHHITANIVFRNLRDPKNMQISEYYRIRLSNVFFCKKKQLVHPNHTSSAVSYSPMRQYDNPIPPRLAAHTAEST